VDREFKYANYHLFDAFLPLQSVFMYTLVPVFLTRKTGLGVKKEYTYNVNNKRAWIRGSVCISFVLTSLDSPSYLAVLHFRLGSAHALYPCLVTRKQQTVNTRKRLHISNLQVPEQHDFENKRRHSRAFK